MAKRKIVSAKTGEVVEKETADLKKENRRKGAMKFRLPAIILWILAIGAEIAAILVFNNSQTIGDNFLIWVIVALVVDAILCIVGALLWKKANRISPCTSKSKVVCFFWNQMGVVACLLAFIPFGIILLKGAKNLDPKNKKILLIVTAVLVAASIVPSIDYRPPTPESVEEAEQIAIEEGRYDGVAYWTEHGRSYHFDTECYTLARSEFLIEGTLDEAFEANRKDPCDICAGGANFKQDGIDEVEVEGAGADLIVTAPIEEEDSLDSAA
jgi:hypothetical protein